jgi:hypothetical protein
LFTIRKAHVGDAFAAVNGPEDMALHCRTSHGEQIQAAEIANPDMVTLLCESDGAYGSPRYWRTPR